MMPRIKDYTDLRKLIAFNLGSIERAARLPALQLHREIRVIWPWFGVQFVMGATGFVLWFPGMVHAPHAQARP